MKPKQTNNENKSFSADRTVQATMLKKMKGKMKRRNTEPTMQVMGPSGIQMTLAAPQEPEEVDSNNTDFWIWYNERLI